HVAGGHQQEGVLVLVVRLGQERHRALEVAADLLAQLALGAVAVYAVGAAVRRQQAALRAEDLGHVHDGQVLPQHCDGVVQERLGGVSITARVVPTSSISSGGGPSRLACKCRSRCRQNCMSRSRSVTLPLTAAKNCRQAMIISSLSRWRANSDRLSMKSRKRRA